VILNEVYPGQVACTECFHAYRALALSVRDAAVGAALAKYVAAFGDECVFEVGVACIAICDFLFSY